MRTSSTFLRRDGPNPLVTTTSDRGPVFLGAAFGVGERPLEVALEGDPVRVLAQTAPGWILTLGPGVAMPGLC